MLFTFIQKLVKAIEAVTGAAGMLAALLILPLIGLTCYDVFARYVLSAPTLWAYEMGMMLTGAYFLLGCGYTLRSRGHVRIDVFFNRMPEKLRGAIKLAGYVFLFLPVGWWLSFALFGYAWDAFETNEHSGQSAWNPVIWPFRVVLASGFFLLTLQASAEALKTVFFLAGRPLEPLAEKEEGGV